MSTSFARAFGRAALVCLVIAASLGTVFVRRAAAAGEPPAHLPRAPRTSELVSASADGETRGHSKSEPMKLRYEGHELLAYPPAQTAASPTPVVYLHGVHGRAENGCPWFRGGASDVGWLVCPEGAVHEANGTASWGGDVYLQGAVVSRALRAVEDQGASSQPGVAVGFSQGGYVALDLVKTRQARFRGLVLIAAPEAHPSAQRLRDAGVVRVVLAAGKEDAAYAPLVEDTKRLQREGMDARFFDLGRVAHTYAAEDPSALRDAIAWASGIGE